MTVMPIHPDDLLFFNEVADAMRKIATKYNLPLRSITGYPMPTQGMADRLGDCNSGGDIRLVMRATENGVWCPAPRTPKDIWRTAAHELAHLKHLNHGVAFQEFEEEMQAALENLTQPNHRQKLITKLIKLQASRQGEAAIGNAEAADAFATMINRLLIENELSPSDLDYARSADDDPIIELMTNLDAYQIDKKKSRIAWQETLASVVANAHLCTFLLRPGSNQIWFVGTRSHATVAEYVYGNLVRAAAKMATTEYFRYYSHCRFQLNDLSKTHGFKNAWITAFVDRIAERLREARAAAVKAAAADVPGSSSQALMRLEGSLVKVRAYIDNKFKGRRGGASALNGGRKNHAEGRARGRAAADAVTLGQRGITAPSGAPRRLLSDGGAK